MLANYLKLVLFGVISNQTCRDHLSEQVMHFLNRDMWALKMFDSTAKIPVGVMTSNIENYGYMDECLEVDVQENFGSFSGKYCIFEFYLMDMLKSSSIPMDGINVKFRWGVCIPSTCSAMDFKLFLNSKLNTSVILHDFLCHTLNEERPLQKEEYFTIFIITVLVILAFLSTMYDYWTPPGKKNELLLSFSIKTNMRILLDTRSPSQTIEFLYGFRVLCTTSVVIGHIYFFYAPYGLKVNASLFRDWLSGIDHIWLTSRAIMVDTFCVMSGMLASYTFIRDREKGEDFSLIKFYIHRYLRMAPVLFFMLLINGTLLSRLGSGPLWQEFSRTTSYSCRTTWWKQMLFINNWWADDTCMEQTWYTAVDMQLYWLAPLVLIPLYKWSRYGLKLVYIVIIACFCMSFGLSYIMEEKVDMFKNAGVPNMRKLYEAAINRTIPWLFGIVFGYYLMKYRSSMQPSGNKNKNEKDKDINWCKFLLATMVLIVSIGLLIFVMVVAYPFMKEDYQYNVFYSAVYLASSHAIWGIGIVGLLATLTAGYGGPLNLFFRWRIFAPLNRLCYSLYIFHLLIVKLYIHDAKTHILLSDYEVFRGSISVLYFSVIGASLLYLLIEQPIAVIEQTLLNKSKKYHNPNSEKKLRASPPPMTGSKFQAEDD